MADRDQMLANFQAITAIEEFDECIAILEQHDWNLEEAVQMAMAMQDMPTGGDNMNFNIPADPGPPSYADVVSAAPEPPPTSGPSAALQPSVFVGPSASIASTAPSTSRGVGQTQPSAFKALRMLNFDIEYRDKNMSLSVPDDQTVGKIKELIQREMGIEASKQLLRGWVARNDCNIEDDEILRDLRLPKDNNLYVLVPDVPSVSRIACPANGEDSALMERLSQNYTLSIKFTDKDRKYRLNFPGTKTVMEVKRDVSDIIDVPVRNQVWSGWPDAATDETMTLAGCSIDYPSHNLEVTSNRNCGYEPLVNQTNNRISPEAISIDSSDEEYTDAPDDFTGGDEDHLFAADSSVDRRQQPLMPPNAKDQTVALEQFMLEFSNRYGDCHPYFFIGTLDDAIREALQVRARERKLLAVYLHHDNSILANVFCSQVLCSESIVAYLSGNFITWAWDLSSEANKARLLTMCTHHFGSVAASTLRSFSTDQLPTLLVITRNRGSNEVFSVIHGNSTVDEVMTSLISAVDVFTETQKAEILEEEERDARESMKQEQDEAYRQSLLADQAKAETKRKEEEEQQRVVQEEQQRQQVADDARRQEEAEKEAIAMSLAEQLPDEPPSNCPHPVSMIRIRCPDSVMLTRRFLATNPVKVVLNFISSKGYHTEDYKVLTTFPRRDLTEEDPSKSLEALKVFPQETLTLESRS